MKKVLIIVVCIIVIGALGAGGYWFWSNMNSTPIIDDSGEGGDVIETEGLADKAIIKSVQIKENATGANRVIDVVYPAIQSFKNKDFQNYVNTAITDVILAYKDEIMVMIDDETPATALYTYKTSYDKYAHGDYLSLVISNDYQTGGIRSNTWKDIYNINVRTERIIYLDDIFPANVDYKKEILDEIALEAKENDYVLMNGQGLKQLDDKQKFFIKDNKLVIYFDASEIAPATYGNLQFEMPFIMGEDGLFRVQRGLRGSAEKSNDEDISILNSAVEHSNETINIVNTSGEI